MAQTSLGIDEKVEGALSYLLFFVSGLIIFLLEQKSTFARFHAAQSTVTFISLFILTQFFSIFYWWHFIASLLILLTLVLWIVGMVKAYQGEWYKFPLFGDLAASLLGIRI
ncbi:MAG: DUF4870 domain-containing protein [Infirmifilum sp.]